MFRFFARSLLNQINTQIRHWRDPIIDTLPSEAAMGCPYLPRKNGYDCIRLARQKVSKTRARIARRLHYYWNKVEGLIT